MTPTDPPVCALDGEQIGSALLRLVMLSAQFGHASPLGTARDYCQHAEQPEFRFVVDVLTCPTDEICDRWFGGSEHAAISAMRQREW